MPSSELEKLNAYLKGYQEYFKKLEQSVEKKDHHTPEVKKMLEETKDLTSYVDFLN